jgi:hypothetical protein
MAFPGTYNINYYKGDTYEFRIYPKDAAGDPFPLADYAGSESFTIANVRGSTATTTVLAYANIVSDYVLCTIRPPDGEDLTAGTTYYYDVSIDRASDESTPYESIFTLLTGTITVTDHVSGAA